MNSIKNYILLLFLLIVCGQSLMGQKPVISSVTVQPNGAVKIIWFPIAGVSGYEIYSDSEQGFGSIGFNPIDTIFGAESNECIDITVDARIQSVGYKIKTLNSKEISDPHYTLFLSQIKYDSCSMTNTLKWNTYVGWEGGAYYKIIDKNGDTIPGGPEVKDTIFIHNIEPGNTYSYIIIAIQEGNSNVYSSSNQQSVYATPIKPPNPDNFYINNIDFNGSTASFTVKIDNSADLLGHSLQVSNFEKIDFFEAAYKEMEGSESIEFLHTVENQPLFYKVASIGVCHDTVLETNVVQPIKLETSGTETEVTLSWNESYIQAIFESYTIHCKVDLSDYITLEPSTERTKTYPFNQLGTETSELFCFKIEALDNENHTSYSNEACVSRIPLVEFPNAFTPNGDGINDVFGPFSNYIKNVDISSNLFEFKIIIYDKYGGAIFESDNAFQKWTGVDNRASLKYVPEGAYIYYMWFKTTQGKSFEKSGSINVVYP